jgi:hypothetical protein
MAARDEGLMIGLTSCRDACALVRGAEVKCAGSAVAEIMRDTGVLPFALDELAAELDELVRGWVSAYSMPDEAVRDGPATALARVRGAAAGAGAAAAAYGL